MKTDSDLFKNLLEQCVEKEGSDLHLSVHCQPVIRIHGKLQSLMDMELQTEHIKGIIHSILSESQKQAFEKNGSVDLAYSLGHAQRFRINMYRERGDMAIAIRRLENSIRELKDLGLPQQLEELTTLRDGLVLFTGPTGSGKSTSLAALLHRINQTQHAHILTIEDPIEYLHSNIKSIIHQRELNSDVDSFANALRSALREDPDVILVGEMRDLATMRAALTAAETGHLVFSTLHCGDTVGALDRILAMYPSEEQQPVRQQLAMSLRAVIAQRLLPRSSCDGRAIAVEILKVTNAVANLIRTGQFPQIYSVLETGMASGMHSLDMSLASLVKKSLVAHDQAIQLTRNTPLFLERVKVRAL